MPYDSDFTGLQIDRLLKTVQDNGPEWSRKQPMLRGSPGQMVGFDSLGNAVPQDFSTVQGPPGPKGDKGEQGPAGPGVPTGGAAGQVLAKNTNADYDTHWIDPPEGGDGSSQKLPVSVKILQTICENVRLNDNSPTYTLKSSLSFNDSDLFFLNYKYFYSDGTLDSTNSAFLISKPASGCVRWLSNDENNSVTLTSSLIKDTWRESGKNTVLDIYRIEISIDSALDYIAINREGKSTTASGKDSHAEGGSTTASGKDSHAEGGSTTASGDYSHAEGGSTTASGYSSHAEGVFTTASGYSSHAEGRSTTASGNYSHASGQDTVAEYYASTAIGRYNKTDSPSTNSNYLSYFFVIGKGSSETSRANVFRVTDTQVFGTGSYNSSGADYAEMFEWADGNPDKEDRAGRFVTLRGDKIVLAKPGDTFILGIVSGNPSVVGDVHDDQWKSMYMYDIFGRPLWEDVDLPAEIGPDGEILMKARTEHRQRINPDYDHTQPYMPRTERPEWDAVGMVGKLVAVDDGTCIADGWCTTGPNGMATRSTERTKYRVMARLDKSHIKVLIL